MMLSVIAKPTFAEDDQGSPLNPCRIDDQVRKFQAQFRTEYIKYTNSSQFV